MAQRRKPDLYELVL